MLGPMAKLADRPLVVEYPIDRNDQDARDVNPSLVSGILNKQHGSNGLLFCSRSPDNPLVGCFEQRLCARIDV